MENSKPATLQNTYFCTSIAEKVFYILKAKFISFLFISNFPADLKKKREAEAEVQVIPDTEDVEMVEN